MAGSFGYEKEHYEVSMKVGELVLFPEVRKASEETIIAAPGTSCRQQIMDGTGAWDVCLVTSVSSDGTEIGHAQDRLSRLDAWLTGLRREQRDIRAAIRTVGQLAGHRESAHALADSLEAGIR